MKRSHENHPSDNSRTTGSEQAEKSDSGFLGRWARRKHDAVADPEQPLADDHLNDRLTEASEHALQPEDTPAELAEPASKPADSDAQPDQILTDADMPDIETLHADSDFSPFFSRGVSKELRNLALKKLFFSGKFSMRDGLDDYDDDFTKFEPLGDTVTSDMKFHARRKEKARLAELEEERLRLEAADDESEGELPETQTADKTTISDAETTEADVAAVDQPEEPTQVSATDAPEEIAEDIETNRSAGAVDKTTSEKEQRNA